MLSLLPPLKTREISPKYNYTVGGQIKGHLLNKSLAQGKSLADKEELKKKKKGRSTSKKKEFKTTQVHHVPKTKIIMSQSGESPDLGHYRAADDPTSSPTQISKHPVMIKAVSSKKSLDKGSD